MEERKHLDPCSFGTYCNLGSFDGVYEVNPVDMNKLEDEIYKLENENQKLNNELEEILEVFVQSGIQYDMICDEIGDDTCNEFKECKSCLKSYFKNNAKG